jgi:predicted Rossmann fold flavoprotein
MHEIVVVGGGAAGLMAAGRAAELGARVMLLEKTARVGAKLALTGHGRGNLAHAGDAAEFVAHLTASGTFMRNALAHFSTADLLARFRALGLDTVVETDGRIYPVTHRATDIVAALRRYCLSGGVHIRTNAAVAGLTVSGQIVCGVQLRDDGPVTADAVVLATGGFSYPQTGSTGDGYRMAEVVGHRVSSPKPGLVAIVLDDASIAALQGVSLSDGVAVLTRDSRLVASRRGEMLFTHFGVSGPIILSLSLAAAEALQGAPCGLSLDVAPDLTWPLFEAQWRQALSSRPRSRCHSLMRGMLPQALAHFVLARSAIPQERPTNQLSPKERKALYETIKNLRFTVSRTRPIKEAMVTVGGVCTQEIDPHTMASRVVQGLYLAGEIIDVAGDTGGYNLQIAFTTGYLAGESAARAQPDGGAT